jgi:glycosyltransferase involved in cell wall biosynthesis
VKVLILHQHFNTPGEGGPLRSFYLAKALLDCGMLPVVITARREDFYRKVNHEGIEVHYLPIAYDNRFGFWKRSVSFLRYVWGSVRVARELSSVKMCYAISVPLTVGLAAQIIKFRYKIPYIFEVGDLWPDAPIELGFVRNFFFKWLLFKLERSIYKGAHSVVALSEPIQSRILKKVPGVCTHLIPNMADTDFYQPEEKNGVLERRFGVVNKFVISYIGAVGFANGLEYYIECARASQQAKLPVHFLLCGDGARLTELRRVVEVYGLGNFTFVPFQDRSGVREVMNVSDATFISYKPVPILETGSPNKYFDGLASGKLIIINFGGWIKKEVEAKQCGIYVDPSDPGDFVKNMSVYVNFPERLVKCQQASRLLAESKYSRIILSNEYTEIFRSLV